MYSKPLTEARKNWKGQKMLNPKYLDVEELAALAKVKQELIIKICCNEKLPFLGLPVEPIFIRDNLEVLLKLIKAENSDLKPVIDIHSGLFYPSAKDAAESIGMSENDLFMMLEGLTRNLSPFRKA
jgi:hypothetical protein